MSAACVPSLPNVPYRLAYLKPRIQSRLVGQWIEVWRGIILVFKNGGWFDVATLSKMSGRIIDPFSHSLLPFGQVIVKVKGFCVGFWSFPRLVAKLLGSTRSSAPMSYASTNNPILHRLSFRMIRIMLFIASSGAGSDKHVSVQSLLFHSNYLLTLSIPFSPLCLPAMPSMVTCLTLATVRLQILLKVIYNLLGFIFSILVSLIFGSLNMNILVQADQQVFGAYSLFFWDSCLLYRWNANSRLR